MSFNGVVKKYTDLNSNSLLYSRNKDPKISQEKKNKKRFFSLNIFKQRNVF